MADILSRGDSFSKFLLLFYIYLPSYKKAIGHCGKRQSTINSIRRTAFILFQLVLWEDLTIFGLRGMSGFKDMAKDTTSSNSGIHRPDKIREDRPQLHFRPVLKSDDPYKYFEDLSVISKKANNELEHDSDKSPESFNSGRGLSSSYARFNRLNISDAQDMVSIQADKVKHKDQGIDENANLDKSMGVQPPNSVMNDKPSTPPPKLMYELAYLTPKVTDLHSFSSSESRGQSSRDNRLVDSDELHIMGPAGIERYSVSPIPLDYFKTIPLSHTPSVCSSIAGFDAASPDFARLFETAAQESYQYLITTPPRNQGFSSESEISIALDENDRDSWKFDICEDSGRPGRPESVSKQNVLHQASKDDMELQVRNRIRRHSLNLSLLHNWTQSGANVCTEDANPSEPYHRAIEGYMITNSSCPPLSITSELERTTSKSQQEISADSIRYSASPSPSALGITYISSPSPLSLGLISHYSNIIRGSPVEQSDLKPRSHLSSSLPLSSRSIPQDFNVARSLTTTNDARAFHFGFALARLEGHAPPAPCSPIKRYANLTGVYSDDVQLDRDSVVLRHPRPRKGKLVDLRGLEIIALHDFQDRRRDSGEKTRAYSI